MVVGKKNRTAASTQRLIDDVPLFAATAIQRGPTTDATLNNSKSHGPIARRSCFLASAGLCSLTRSRPARGLAHPAAENCGEKDRARLPALSTFRKMSPRLPEEISRGRPAFFPDAYRASPRWKSYAGFS